MLQVQAFLAFMAQPRAWLDGLVVVAAELARHLARVVGAEAVANGLLRVLDVVAGLGLSDCMWLALVPADVAFKVLRSGVAAFCRISTAMPPSGWATTPLPGFPGPDMRCHRTSATTPSMRGTVMHDLRDHFIPRRRPRKRGARALGAVAAVVVSVGLTVGALGGAPGSAATASAGSHIRAADAALAKASAQVRARQYRRAVRSLASAARHTGSANTAAQALIGAPPTDPESDDPPGPPAVLAATKLDYRVSTGAVALLDDLRRPTVVRALRRTVRVAQVRRDEMLDEVIALPEEGDGADYADGLADTLGQYQREVDSLAAALDSFTLSPGARIGVTNALSRARATNAKMVEAFGGGE
ncbi:hypothetical protein EXE57_14150 [Nocardioides euryhalodurans]|uniref:Uncharacterized protein n=2 Tax=Nocardioides euryhalodurans TaxID=2518370 RepID=A0A4P7GMB5_9ACTN|nr:hypothetical protein EXE57_14150 [Nocardioides euryhalodurans]